MIYCGLVSPHRSVGGHQSTLTAPLEANGRNETMRGAPTAVKELALYGFTACTSVLSLHASMGSMDSKRRRISCTNGMLCSSNSTI